MDATMANSSNQSQPQSQQQSQQPYVKRLEGVAVTEELIALWKQANQVDAQHRPTALADFRPGVDAFLPIRVIVAMKAALQHTATTTTTTASSNSTSPPSPSSLLSTALHHTHLYYTPPLPPDDDRLDELTPAQRHFRQRMQRLQCRQEERRYAKLTQNLGLASVTPDDGITTKSMTYAASIGLNMIVAPVSFGVFMYFFGGSLLVYIWPSTQPLRQGQADIKKVIVGVVSGVGMLFVEMLLFVIRTHEMDKAMRKKSRRTKPQGPFGYYTAATSKTFVTENQTSTGAMVHGAAQNDDSQQQQHRDKFEKKQK